MITMVTGANGFVGSAVCGVLNREGLSVRAVVRSLGSKLDGAEAIVIGDLSSVNDWTVALSDVDQVVHLAARAHVANVKSSNLLDELRRVNVEGTANLARQAAAAGVRRFVYLSSIKVNGDFTEAGHRFYADDIPVPKDSYGVSKYEAEELLRRIAGETGMEVVIIRPPLVYGPGVKANFESMMRWLSRGVPLPLAAVTKNRRSLVALDNLVDLILTCLQHPKAANQTFLVSDGEDLSTTELLQRMGKAMNRPTRLLWVPVSLLAIVSRLLGKTAVAQRLLGSLQVDISKTYELLDWRPPVSVDDGLRKVVQQRL